MQSIILRMITVCVYFLYNCYAFHYASGILTKFQKNIPLFVLLSAVNTFFLFFSNRVNSPYFVTYLVGLAILTCEFYFFSKSKLSQAYFGASTFVLHIVCFQMLVVSIMSLVLNRQSLDMILVPDLFSYNILFTFSMMLLSLVIFKNFVFVETIRIISSDREQSILVSLIATFIILYSCLDTVVFSRPGIHDNLANTIICVEIMSLTVFYALLLHAVKISNMNHYKAHASNLEHTLRENLKTEERLKRLIFKDNLTGCYSKAYVLEYLDRLLEEKRANFCLVYIDLDGLKLVNDTYGHIQGDAYLTSASRCIAHSIRENDIFARMGGDEFMLILEDCIAESIDMVFKRIQENLNRMKSKDMPYTMSLSYGVLYVSQELLNCSRQELIGLVDKKMYDQKQLKK